MQGLSDMSLNCTVRRFVITLFFLLQCTSVQAQQSILPNELRWHFGLELFQMLLEERGMTIMQSLESSLDSPSNSVIVVTGDLRRLPSDIGGRLVQFVRRGGNVLLASDQPRRMTGIARERGFGAGLPARGAHRRRQHQQPAQCGLFSAHLFVLRAHGYDRH